MEATDFTDSFNAVFNAPEHAKRAITALEAARHHMTVKQFTERYQQWLDHVMFTAQSAS